MVRSPTEKFRLIASSIGSALIGQGWNDQIGEKVQRGETFLWFAILRRRHHYDQREIRHDEDALSAPAERGDPSHLASAGQRAPDPPLIAVEQRAAEIADRLEAWNDGLHDPV